MCWFHIVMSSYGSWLYGDSRGFRTRHHCEHVEGDYKNPPPAGLYAWREHNSRKSLKQPPVVFPRELRQVLGEAIRDRLAGLGAYILTIAAGGQHVHVQAKMPRESPRAWAGLAKKHAWFEARDHRGWVGKMWGQRSKAVPITNKQHQENTCYSILDHIHEGAWTWSALWKSPPVATGGL